VNEIAISMTDAGGVRRSRSARYHRTPTGVCFCLYGQRLGSAF
jgi:hypothetical protein